MARRPQVAEGPELRARLHRGLREHAVGLEQHAVAQRGVEHLAARAHHAVGADGGAAEQAHAGLEHGVDPDADRVVDVGGGGIDHRHAARHQPIEDAAAHDRGQLRHLAAVVDAEALGRILGDHRLQRLPVAVQDADDVGEVVLVLGVVGSHAIERGPEPSGVEAVHAGADLADLALGTGGVAVLHDAGRTPALAYHAPVAGRVRHQGGEQRRGRPARHVMLDQPTQGRLGQERHVAGQHQDGARRVAARHMGLEHRVAGA